MWSHMWVNKLNFKFLGNSNLIDNVHGNLRELDYVKPLPVSDITYTRASVLNISKAPFEENFADETTGFSVFCSVM